MIIGDRLRAFREEKKLSQGDIEQRTGLFRCYTSRVENGHTVPSIETLEKYARALEIPLYQLFYDGDEKASRACCSPKTQGRGRYGLGAFRQGCPCSESISQASESNGWAGHEGPFLDGSTNGVQTEESQVGRL
jgi:transcriptional regulator with XRE-family HTH domain